MTPATQLPLRCKLGGLPEDATAAVLRVFPGAAVAT